MIYPDIKTYREDKWRPKIAPLSDRPHFMGRSALDVRWNTKKPAVNIKQDGVHFEMKIVMPGFAKDEIIITVDNDILTVRGEKKRLEKADSAFVLQEFDMDVVERKFKLAKNIGREKIDAVYRNGILTLTFEDISPNPGKSRKRVKVF